MGKYIIAGVALFLLLSCKKASDIGSNLLGDDDLFLTYTDTFTIIAQSDYDSTIRSDRTVYSYLGHIDDPYFGKSEATVFTQFTLLTKFKDTIAPVTLDSIILYLQYDKFNGDSTFPQSFNVYKSLETPLTGDIYYSDQDFLAGDLIGSVSGVTFSANGKYYFDPKDTVGTAGIIRIPLTTAFGNELINQALLGNLAKDSLFKNFLPGMIIKPAGGNGKGMAQIDLRSVSTKFTLYYKNKDNDTLKVDFPTALTTFWHDRYMHDYSGAPATANIKTSAAAGDATTLVQGQAGIKTLLSLPTISSIGKVAVNKAELEIYQIYDPGTTNLPAPKYLYAHSRDDAGKYSNISDFGLIATFGVGYYSKQDTIIDNMSRKVLKYTINISDYLQDVISGKIANQPIYISDYPVRSTTPTSIAGDYAPYRLILGGSDRTDEYKVKLKLKYSLPK